MSRAAILSNIRRALGEPGARRQAVSDRLRASAEAPSLVRTRLPPEELIALFKVHVARLCGDLIEVAAPAAIPAAVARYLQSLQQPLRVRMGSDPLLASMPWGDAVELTVDRGPALQSDTAGLSRAVAGVAETGTLVLASGPHNPVTLAFVPDLHLVVLLADRIVASYEQACARVRDEMGGAALPRSLNFITGASRTGDIGGRIVMGAHGPRQLAVFLVDND